VRDEVFNVRGILIELQPLTVVDSIEWIVNQKTTGGADGRTSQTQEELNAYHSKSH